MKMKEIGKKVAGEVKNLVWQGIRVAVIVAIAGGAIWAIAAFVEPTAGPADSDQDFTQNILGANDANNDFDSSSVAANGDGSMIERLEDIKGLSGAASDAASMSDTLFAGQQYIADNMQPKRGPVIAMSAESAVAMTHANAAKYCYDLSAPAAVAMDGNTTTTYTDWRLPTVGEAAVFEGTITSGNYVYTSTVYEATLGSWIKLRLSDGYWLGLAYDIDTYVRCVR